MNRYSGTRILAPHGIDTEKVAPEDGPLALNLGYKEMVRWH